MVKTGFAAYVQFAHSFAASHALGLEMILNGDPYTLCRIAADDRIDHAQVIENMKDIKYRKPYVMVENYPELPFEDLARYKSNFESIAPVRHFKIAPTGDNTVTLALCMDRADDRDLVIGRFNGAIISDKKLKVYMAPGKARMTPAHVAKYAICKNSITVDNVRPCRWFWVADPWAGKLIAFLIILWQISKTTTSACCSEDVVQSASWRRSRTDGSSASIALRRFLWLAVIISSCCTGSR